MAREHLSSLLIPRDDGLGILTDRDLRTKVVAARRSLETPVGEVMTFPASAVSHDAMAGEVLLLMLDGGFHHAPVVDASGKPIGVVTDTDLLGLGKHAPFALKSSIERAADRDSAVQAALGLPDVVCSLVDVHADPVDVGHIVGFTIDALTRRLISLAIERYGEPPVPWAWLALGSAARQEQALHTDQDHALAYDLQGRTREEVDPYFADLAEFVTAGLEDAGIPRCDGDAMAANSALRKSIEGWTDAYKGWMTDPGVEGSVLLSIVFDYRRVMGPLDAEGPLDELLRSCKLLPELPHTPVAPGARREASDRVLQGPGRRVEGPARRSTRHQAQGHHDRRQSRAGGIHRGWAHREAHDRQAAGRSRRRHHRRGDAGRARGGVPVPVGRAARAPRRSRPRR